MKKGKEQEGNQLGCEKTGPNEGKHGKLSDRWKKGSNGRENHKWEEGVVVKERGKEQRGERGRELMIYKDGADAFEVY